jgi:hypothetical protein
MEGIASSKSVVHGGKELKAKVSNTNLAASGVLGQRRVNQVVNVKAEPAVKAGAKRPALGNISNSGIKVCILFHRHLSYLTIMSYYRIPMSTPTSL